MIRRQQLDRTLDGSVSEVFAVLGSTLAFRRWRALPGESCLPPAGCRYRYQAGSVLRLGRVVEINRPVGLTLKEVLHDPPCRVLLTMRWRIDPAAIGSVVRLRSEYRLNRAASFRRRHWDWRLKLHFERQFSFLGRNLLLARKET